MEQEKSTKPETDSTFPEDDDALYREMTEHMPRCYFPTSLGENSILKFAGEEFRRVKNIVCRRYNFNEDKYIRENAGVSPFDSVRGNFEQEVYRRLRKDYAHLSIISIRRLLMEKIRNAVKKENNIIGTFYRNCGVHYQEVESPEYETSPIVVVHNPVFYGYGGYEGATVYELFIDGNGKLLCTLNGEAGEDFDEPIGQVQTEGLLEIAHWLEEHGFISADVNDDRIVVCEECGSDNIQTQAWVDPNARTFIGTTGIDRYDNCATNARTISPLLRSGNSRNVCRNGGTRWTQIKWNRSRVAVRTSVRPETTIRGLLKPAMNGGKTRAMTRNVKSGKNITTADYDLQSS